MKLTLNRALSNAVGLHTGVGTSEDLCQDLDSTPEMLLETSQRISRMSSGSSCNNTHNEIAQRNLRTGRVADGLIFILLIICLNLKKYHVYTKHEVYAAFSLYVTTYIAPFHFPRKNCPFT